MRKARAVWEELPINFKMDVVDRLDYRSRCRLKSCSTSDNQIVKIRPSRLSALIISPPNEITICGRHHECSGTDELLQMILTIFKHPKTFVKTVSFKFDRENESESLLDSFVCSMKLHKTKNPSFKLRAEKLHYEEYHRQYLEGRFLDVLECFEPKVLRSIMLTSNPSEAFSKHICTTEQWKNAKESRSYGLFEYDFPMDYYKHFNKLNAPRVERLSGDQCWTIIKSFISRNAPNGSSFRFDIDESLKFQEIFSKFSVPAKDEPIASDIPLYLYEHTQRFQMADPKNILIVKFANHAMEAAVVRKDCMSEDLEFKWAVFGPRIVEW